MKEINHEIGTGVFHELPEDLEKVLRSNQDLLFKWNNLTPLARNEWICWVTIVKKPETREEHIKRLSEEIMEGKKRPCCWPGCPHRRESAQKIMTLHPGGKQGVNILLRRYEVIKTFILSKLKEHSEISFDELTAIAVKELSANFDGKVVWYMVTVKLDLEARKLIERVPKTSPHKLRLTKEL